MSSISYNPDIYNEEYYRDYSGMPYDRTYDNGYWLKFFERIASMIVENYQPRRTLDVGCAKGFLVEQLRSHGVHAYGFDVSPTAIKAVSPQIKEYCYQGSADNPSMYDGYYDVITTIEVLEHLTHDMCERVVRLICEHTDVVVFSSTPDGFEEPSHINVRPQGYWSDLFRKNGFERVEEDTWVQSVIIAHAMVFRKKTSRDIERVKGSIEEIRLQTQQQGMTLDAVHNRLSLLEQTASNIASLLDISRQLQTDMQSVALQLDGIEQQRLKESIERETREKEKTALEGEITALRESVDLKETHIQNIQSLLGLVQQENLLMKQTIGWRLLNVFRILRHFGAHPFSTGRKVAYSLKNLGIRGTLDRIRDKLFRETQNMIGPSYDLWCRNNEKSFLRNIDEIRTEILSWAERPMISILMPTYNSKISWLEDAITSLTSQPYDKWELVICDDASPNKETVQYLSRLEKLDPRIRVVMKDENGGISAATNTALEIAHGDLVTFLDHDDILAPQALYEVAKSFIDQGFDILYSDEDKLDEAGKYIDPFFKPDYSPDYLLSCNYVNHLTVYTREIVERVGRFRPQFDGAQDHDFLLRAVELATTIRHIPKVLYHWRKVPGSTAADFSSKSYAHQAGERAVSEALQRRGTSGDVLETGFPGHYRVRRDLNINPLVSIIIPVRDKVDVLKTCIDSIKAKSTYNNYEIIIVDNGSTKQETLDYFQTLTDIRVLRLDIAFNYSRLNNLAVAETHGDYLLFLNNDVEVITETWLEEMLQHSCRPEVGVVGAKLLYPDNRIQHAGIVLGIGGVAGHSHKYFPRMAGGYFSSLADIRNYSAVTAACMMVRKEIFLEVGGFDEDNLAVAFNDVDFCLRVCEKGYLCVYTPHAELYHYESLTRGKELNPKEVYYMMSRWKGFLENDPYYNRHLSLEREDYSLALS